MIYQNVLTMCRKNNISISALEKGLGFGKCTIARWENSCPGADKLTAVADYFNVPVDFLIRGDVSASIQGSLTVTKSGEAICGGKFSDLAEMVRLMQLFVNGKTADVQIRLEENMEMGR